MQAGLVFVLICLAICAIAGVAIGVLSFYKVNELSKRCDEIDTKINNIDLDDLQTIQQSAGQLITDIRKQYLTDTS